MKVLLTTILSLAMFSCGMVDKCDTNKADASCSTAKSTGGITFSGYVSPAFALKVDDQQFSDSEDYYTQTLDKMSTEATASGYDGWKVKFDAEIGLEDMKFGMAVYVAADSKTGFAAETSVKSNGTFSVDFPAEAAGENYMVRTNKRVSVTLVNPNGDASQNVFWCYNFSGVDKNVPVSEAAKPIILNTFMTKITKYKCSNSTPSSTSGIAVPKTTTALLPAAAAPAVGSAPAAEALNLHVCVLKDGSAARSVTNESRCDDSGGEWLQTGTEKADEALNRQ